MRTALAASCAAAALALAAAGAAVAAPPAPDDGNRGDRAKVCHVTGSATNPIVEVYVPEHANPPRDTSCDPGGEL